RPVHGSRRRTMNGARALSCEGLRWARERSKLLINQNAARRAEADQVLADATAVMRRCLETAAATAGSNRTDRRRAPADAAREAPAEPSGAAAPGGAWDLAAFATIAQRITGLESQLADLEAFASDLLLDAERLVFALDVDGGRAREAIPGRGGKLILFPA